MKKCECPDCSDIVSVAKEDLPCSNKPELAHILKFPLAMAALSNAYEYGMKRDGAPSSGTLTMTEDKMASKLLRHLSLHMSGEKIDPDSGLPHLAHFMFNATALTEKGLK